MDTTAAYSSELAAQVDWLGSKVDGRYCSSAFVKREPGELSQWWKHRTHWSVHYCYYFYVKNVLKI